ncbi:hypothetical protein F5Y17DRAFT_430270 [Xylariaceae sp. FL0594]|nr:hypothetical protein F5Y17DRAFT_430270 [Xylariaceae sp. FL0594]
MTQSPNDQPVSDNHHYSQNSNINNRNSGLDNNNNYYATQPNLIGTNSGSGTGNIFYANGSLFSSDSLPVPGPEACTWLVACDNTNPNAHARFPLAPSTNTEPSFIATGPYYGGPTYPAGGVLGQTSVGFSDYLPATVQGSSGSFPVSQFLPGVPEQFGSGNGSFRHRNHLQGPQSTQQVLQQPYFQFAFQNSYAPTAPLSAYPLSSSNLPPMSNTFRPGPTARRQGPPPNREPAPNDDTIILNFLATHTFSSPSLRGLNCCRQPSPITLPTPNAPEPATIDRDMPQTLYQRSISSREDPVDLTKEEPDSLEAPSGIDVSIPMMRSPSVTRGQSNAAPATERKRRASVTSSSNRPSKTRRQTRQWDFSDGSSLFGDDDDDVEDMIMDQEIETIDLSNATSVPLDLVAPQADNRVKIGTFQCVICMDDTTALTVTHCGMAICSPSSACSR